MMRGPEVAIGVPKAVSPELSGTRHCATPLPQAAAFVETANCCARTLATLPRLSRLKASQLISSLARSFFRGNTRVSRVSGDIHWRAILTWLRDRNMPITAQSLGLALTNILNSGKRPLHFRREPVPEKFGRHSGKTFESWKKDDGNRDYVHGLKNHSRNPAFQPKPTPAQDARLWQQRAESVRGDRHSRRFSNATGFDMNSAPTTPHAALPRGLFAPCA